VFNFAGTGVQFQTVTLFNLRGQTVQFYSAYSADMFEVSVRTIYRDIEALSQAGIPVFTYQGTTGGIGIVRQYKLDKTFLTDDEFALIYSALKNVSSSYNNSNAQWLLEKIKSIIPPSQKIASR
jgi:predicted DNA-binding transcriptional regulator YafY